MKPNDVTIIKTVEKIAPGENVLHLFLSDGPRLKIVEIPRNSIEININHLARLNNIFSLLLMNSYSIK